MAVLFAFASALQQMRCDSNDERRLSQHATYANVFALRNVTHNYDEALLQAILLRLVTRKEWGEEKRKDSQEEVRKVAAKPERDILLDELLLATVKGLRSAVRRKSILGSIWSEAPRPRFLILEYA
jgi:hypothetical protein